jgi:hypothetical protein
MALGLSLLSGFMVAQSGARLKLSEPVAWVRYDDGLTQKFPLDRLRLADFRYWFLWRQVRIAWAAMPHSLKRLRGGEAVIAVGDYSAFLNPPPRGWPLAQNGADYAPLFCGRFAVAGSPEQPLMRWPRRPFASDFGVDDEVREQLDPAGEHLREGGWVGSRRGSGPDRTQLRGSVSGGRD